MVSPKESSDLLSKLLQLLL